MGELLSQKTFWAGLGLIGLGIFQVVNGDIENGIQSISEGLGLIFLRQAIARGAGLGKN